MITRALHVAALLFFGAALRDGAAGDVLHTTLDSALMFASATTALRLERKHA